MPHNASPSMEVSHDDTRDIVRRICIGTANASLRREDEKKALELAGLLHEIGRTLLRVARRRGPLRIVDAAAGRGYVGIAAARLLAPRLGLPVHVTFIERDTSRCAAIGAAWRACALEDSLIACHANDVGDPSPWPQQPELVVALHACGDATDRIIEQGTASLARNLLIIPCCVAGSLPSALRANHLASSLGAPRHAEVRRRYVEAHVLAERVQALEAAGYHTETLAFVPSSVSPYNIALRSRRVGESVRMHAARESLQLLQSSDAVRLSSQSRCPGR